MPKGKRRKYEADYYRCILATQVADTIFRLTNSENKLQGTVQVTANKVMDDLFDPSNLQTIRDMLAGLAEPKSK